MVRFLLAVFALLLFVTPAHARPKLKTARAQARLVEKSQDRLATIVAQLSAKDRARLKALLSRASEDDSDNDGVGDLYEVVRGSGVCDSDSDDDGISDGEDSDEKDPDSDDDGHLDGTEVQLKGEVVSYAAPNLVIGWTTFIVNGSTTFEGISEGALTAGVC